MQLGSRIAVAVEWASGCSSDVPMAQELPCAMGAALEKKKDKKKSSIVCSLVCMAGDLQKRCFEDALVLTATINR